MKFVRYALPSLFLTSLIACSSNSQNVSLTPETPPPAPAETKITSLNTQTERYSYALGMSLGKVVTNINVPLDIKVLIQAIQDEVAPETKTLMNDTLAELALQDLSQEMQKKELEEERAQSKKALEEQVAFLSENIKDSLVKTTPKGVQYKIIKAGTGISPKSSEKVQVHYIGALLDGTEFDNSVKRGEPLEFPVAAVIEGWQDLLLVLKEGDKVKAWIPSELAYGAQGVPPLIPGNSLLVFEVELLKVYAEVPPVDSTAIAPTDTTSANTPTTQEAPAQVKEEAEAK